MLISTMDSVSQNDLLRIFSDQAFHKKREAVVAAFQGTCVSINDCHRKPLVASN